MTSPTRSVKQLNSSFFCRFGTGSGRIWLDNVRCRGTESRLTSCRRNSYGAHNCVHSEDVAIYCSTTSSSSGTSASGKIHSSSLPAFIILGDVWSSWGEPEQAAHHWSHVLSWHTDYACCCSINCSRVCQPRQLHRHGLSFMLKSWAKPFLWVSIVPLSEVTSVNHRV